MAIDNNDWEAHKLLLMQEVTDLKEGQKDIRKEVAAINTKVTVLQVKAMFATAIVSFVMSGIVAFAVTMMSAA